jgi:hypothetical protein
MYDVFKDTPRELSVLETTAMRIEGEELIERLELKLEQYRLRAVGWRDDIDLSNFNENELLRVRARVFKEPILDYVVGVARMRDTTTEPINMAEVALAVGKATGYDLALSATIPFRMHESGIVHVPDHSSLAAEATPEDAAFSEAYGVIMNYANNKLWAVFGGTGLPPLPDRE